MEKRKFFLIIFDFVKNLIFIGRNNKGEIVMCFNKNKYIIVIIIIEYLLFIKVFYFI